MWAEKVKIEGENLGKYLLKNVNDSSVKHPCFPMISINCSCDNFQLSGGSKTAKSIKYTGLLRWLKYQMIIARIAIDFHPRSNATGFCNSITLISEDKNAETSKRCSYNVRST